MSRDAHPDKNGGADTVFVELARAYEVLLDGRKKKEYDEGKDLNDIESEQQDSNVATLREEIDK